MKTSQSLPSALETGGSAYPTGPQAAGHATNGTYCPVQCVTEVSIRSAGPKVCLAPPSHKTWTKASAGAGFVSSSQPITSVPSDLWSAHGNHWCAPPASSIGCRPDHVSPASKERTMYTFVSDAGPAEHGS